MTTQTIHAPHVLVNMTWYGNARELRVRMSRRERAGLHPGDRVWLYDDGVEAFPCTVVRVDPDDSDVDVVRVD